MREHCIILLLLLFERSNQFSSIRRYHPPPNRFWRNIRSLERDSDKISKELDIRADLRNWDREFPYFHHELIIRYVAGFMASAMAVAAWGQLRSLFSNTKKR